VRNKSERVQLEMQIMKYRQFLLLIDDEAFRRTAKEKIAELENKLREIASRAASVGGFLHSALKAVFIRILKPVENCNMPYWRRGFSFRTNFPARGRANARPFVIPDAMDRPYSDPITCQIIATAKMTSMA
jgi:hypothetical protein